MKERAGIFGGITWVVAILFVIGGIGMGFLGEDYSFLATFITWVVGALDVSIFYAIYVHIDNQETLISLTDQQNRHMEKMLTFYAADKSSGNQSSGNQSSGNPDFWTCKKCGAKNPKSTMFCRDCGEFK